MINSGGSLVNRVEKFRHKKQIRKKYILSFLLFTILLVGGITSVDYSVNNIMQNKNSLQIISFNKLNDSIIEISFFDEKLYLNLTYINRDYRKLKRGLK